jgi:hypothetical protein
MPEDMDALRKIPEPSEIKNEEIKVKPVVKSA